MHTPVVALYVCASWRGVVLLAAIARVYELEAIHPGNIIAVKLPLMRARLQKLQVPACSNAHDHALRTDQGITCTTHAQIHLTSSLYSQ